MAIPSSHRNERFQTLATLLRYGCQFAGGCGLGMVCSRWMEGTMIAAQDANEPRPETLVEIIHAQTEIAKLGLDLGAVMDFVAGRVQQLTGAVAAVVELAEDADMVYRAVSGLAHAQLGLRLKRVGSLSGLCVQTGQILRCDDSEHDERVDLDACRRVGVRSMLVAPLSHHGTPVGVLKIASPDVAAFGDGHARILELMSGLIAASMYHASRHNPDDLYYRATHDPLTGLANRSLFYDRLRQCLSLAARRGKPVGIVNLDMNDLKLVNDRYGHRAGDATLCEMAARIARISRRSDTAARLGGDEFGVVLAEVESRADVTTHAERLNNEIRLPFSFENVVMPLSASIGCAVYPEDGTDIDVLIDRADQSMYQAKRARQAL
jgi:diguanylate cyclase (GGDEF)-like protein